MHGLYISLPLAGRYTALGKESCQAVSYRPEQGKQGNRNRKEAGGTMRIITISRQFGSGGRELGKRLSDQLGCDY